MSTAISARLNLDGTYVTRNQHIATGILSKELRSCAPSIPYTLDFTQQWLRQSRHLWYLQLEELILVGYFPARYANFSRSWIWKPSARYDVVTLYSESSRKLNYWCLGFKSRDYCPGRVLLISESILEWHQTRRAFYHEWKLAGWVHFLNTASEVQLDTSKTNIELTHILKSIPIAN